MSFNEMDNDLLENVGILIDTYIHLNIDLYIYPNFHSTVVKSVAELLNLTTADAFEGTIEEDMFNEVVEQGMALFYKHIMPSRSNGNTFIRIKPNVKQMRKKIEYLMNIPQPEQRTPAWYEFRSQCLTASNIWKAFISESTRNQLIFEKCQPLNLEKYNGVCLDSPMHWGQKYEPLSIKLYEKIYKTKIRDFGCIPHKKERFLAASPDGINTLETSARYGRMLEVKNIVNREITGIPKMEYWIQMQMQLEVCDLNECDFLETRFQEYENVEAFEADTLCKLTRGMIMLFMRGGQPVYEYAEPVYAEPVYALALENPYTHWQEAMMEKHQDLTWLKNIYWKLDQLSCVLVLRNKVWFASAIPTLKEIWQTIETEKKTGYHHRGPKKNVLKVKKLDGNNNNIMMPSKCFITI